MTLALNYFYMFNIETIYIYANALRSTKHRKYIIRVSKYAKACIFFTTATIENYRDSKRKHKYWVRHRINAVNRYSFKAGPREFRSSFHDCDISGAWYICNIDNSLYVASYNTLRLYIMYASIIDVTFITLSYLNVDAKVRAWRNWTLCFLCN